MREEIEVKKHLRNKLISSSGQTIYQRGNKYFRDNLVSTINFSDEGENKIEITAEVLGNDEYEVCLDFNFKNQNFSNDYCDCPYDDFCKHLVALGLKFIEIYSIFLTQFSVEEFENAEEEKKKFLGWYRKNERDLKLGKFDLENSQNLALIQKGIEIDSDFLKKLESIGIDPKKLPVDVLENLIKSSQNFVKENSTSKNITSKFKKDFQERYEIVLEISYNLRFSLREKKQKGSEQNVFNAYELELVLDEEKEKMTNEQIELLTLWQEMTYYSADFDFEKFLDLIKKSNLEVFFEVWGDNKKITVFDKPQEKVSAGLFVKKEKDLLSLDENKTNNIFVFGLDKRFFQNKHFRLVFSEKGALVLNDKRLWFQKFPEEIIQVFKKDNRNKRKYIEDESNFFCISLTEEEIININDLTKKFQQYFKLETEIKDDFEIKQFSSAKKCFLVDYNKSESTLKLYPAVDYGFKEVPVSQSVFLSRRGYQESYQRKDFCVDQKYVLESDLKKRTIYFSKVAKKQEVFLFKEIVESENLGFNKRGFCSLKGYKNIWKFYENNWQEIKDLKYPIKFLQDEFNFKEDNFKADFNVDFNADKDWLSFDVDCYCGENKITLETLRNYVSGKDDFIETANGELVRVSNREELEKFVAMLESFYQKEKSGNKFEGKMYNAPELNNILTKSDYYNSKLDESFKQFIQEAKSGKPVEKVKLPKDFKKTLRDYQEAGLDWFYFLRKYRFAGILADDMGLGKTLQSLILMQMNMKKNCPSLVVCPKTLLYNWEMEAKKFLPDMKVSVVDGLPQYRKEKIETATENDLIVTSYSTLQRDLELYKENKVRFNYCVLDEAQMIKNHQTKNAQVVKQIDADYRLALTGTPLENTVAEIWSIFAFLMPGFLGSQESFQKRFVKPIMKENSRESLKELKEKISCFMLRRTKEEVLKELPPKIENVNYLHLEDSQNILYQEILANVKSNIFDTVQEKGFAKSQIHILAGLTKLRQVCNHPVLLLKDKNYTEYKSAKLEAFNELIREITSAGKKVLVFSQFTKMLDILQDELKKNEIKHLYLSGQTKNRQEIINKFNEDEATKVFLISLKAGGVGLNLTVADNVIIFDPWWNPSVENQAIDRTHRIGQTKSVNVYRLITKGTIEEKIVELQKKKKSLFDNLVGESKDMFQKLTWEDVQSLFES